MSFPSLPKVYIAAGDKSRLKRAAQFATNQRVPTAAFLRAEIGRAEICPEKDLPEQTVVLDSCVTYRIDWSPAQRGRLVLQCNGNEEGISLLSPLGVALLGLRRGDRMPFFAEDRTFRLLTVLDVQPPTDAQDEPRPTRKAQ